jgi:hypothetical protein
MRKQSLILLICAAILFPVFKANAGVSAGIMLGSPSVVTIKIDNTVVLGIGGWNYGMVVTADHWIIHNPIPTSSVELNWYLGIGGEIGFWNDYDPYWHHYYNNSGFLGVRIPVGLQILFEQRWEAFVEIAPVLVIPPFYPIADGGIGIRYTF